MPLQDRPTKTCLGPVGPPPKAELRAKDELTEAGTIFRRASGLWRSFVQRLGFPVNRSQKGARKLRRSPAKTSTVHREPLNRFQPLSLQRQTWSWSRRTVSLHMYLHMMVISKNNTVNIIAPSSMMPQKPRNGLGHISGCSLSWWDRSHHDAAARTSFMSQGKPGKHASLQASCNMQSSCTRLILG